MGMQPNTTIVRIACPQDEPGILELCWLAHEERPERSLSKPKAQSMVQSCLTGNSGVIGVVDVDSDIRAMVGLVISAAWCSEDLELYDWLVFVRPDCRHLRYLTPLLAFSKEQAIRLGIPLWMGFVGDDRVAAKGRAYHRHFPKFGEFFRFDPHTHQAA